MFKGIYVKPVKDFFYLTETLNLYYPYLLNFVIINNCKEEVMAKEIIFDQPELKDPPKIIFSDIDGTLLNSYHSLSDRTRLALKEASLKFPIIFSSGRNPQALISMHQVLLKKAPLISLNGALILDENFKPLFQQPIQAQYIAKFLNDFLNIECDCAINFYTASNWYTNNPNYFGQIHEEKIVGFPAKVMPLPFPIEEEPILKIMVIAGSLDIPKIYEYLKENYPFLKIVRSRNDLIELYDLNTSKGTALEKIVNFYGFNTSEALAIGDSPLDYPLLEKAGYKAAVNNAYYELRELANIHLPNNDEDGAALLLEYYTKQVQ